jgi:hypothetical protein
MLPIPNLTSASSALPTLNIHAHGHKKGSHVGSPDDSTSSSSAQAPAGSVQNLFGTLLQSVEQVIGLQLSPAKPAAAATTAAAGAGASTTAATAPPTGAATAPTQSAGSLLQNYLNNLSQTLRTNGSQTPKAAGSTVRVDA